MLGHNISSGHPNPAQAKAPAIPQPKVIRKIYEDQWYCSTREWTLYKNTVITTTDKHPVYELKYCSADLNSSAERAHPTISTNDEVHLHMLKAIKRHTFVPVAVSVLSTELFAMKQDHSEKNLVFSSCALGKARNFQLTAVSQTMMMLTIVSKQVVLAGICDEEIKHKVLTTDGNDEK